MNTIQCSSNLIGIDSTWLASVDFNGCPQKIHIGGTRELHHGLFTQLSQCYAQREAAASFSRYMEDYFELGATPSVPSTKAHRFKPNYLDLLRAWGFDSNSPPGAVLKGWVESRFGLIPLYHKEVLGRFPSPAWVAYLEEKSSSRFHDSVIALQLDALYEYCQWSLRRFRCIEETHIRLWRGIRDADGQFRTGLDERKKQIVDLNNLVSFSESPERAEEFGEWIVEADIPLAKILFYPGMLADSVLSSEREFLVIGGQFSAKVHRGYVDPDAD